MSAVREYCRGREGRTVGSGSALCSHSGWTRARLNQSSVVGWSGGTRGQGMGPNVRSSAGTSGGDGSGLLGQQHWLRAEAAAQARAVEAQTRGPDCCARLCVPAVGSSGYGRQGTGHSAASQG